MKTLTKLLLCIPIAWLLTAASCKKDKGTDDGLPPLTFEGKNTIGCKIDGVPWVPKGIFTFAVVLYPTSGGYYVDPFYSNVHVLLKTNSPDGEIELFCRNYSGTKYLQPGTYYFNKKTQQITGYYEKHSYGYYYFNNKEYITDSLHRGWIEILKSDTINKIISGRFEFDAYNSTDGKIYKITDGRFDVTNS